MDYDWALTDFEAAIPAARGSRLSRPGLWQIVDYRTASFEGKLIMASPEASAPEIRIPLPLKGVYDLVFGLCENFCDSLKVKLASDRCFDRLCHSPKVAPGFAFQDVFWRTAQLDGKETLVIRQDRNFRAAVGYIWAKKAEAEAVKNRKQLLLHVTDDGFPSNWGVPEDDEDAVWMIEAMARANADMVSRGTDLQGMANYATKQDSLRINAAERLKEQFSDKIYEDAFRILDDWIKRDYRVPRRYFQLARQYGMKAFAYGRMAHVHCAPPYQTFRSEFYDQHPEFRCLDIDGGPVNRLSIAFPEVRKEFLKLFLEGVEMGADGINNVFVRGLPLVCYEEPLRARLRQLHGLELTDIPESDPLAEGVRAEFVTEYMREQRRALDDGSKERKASIMATVPATEEVCNFYGLDLRGWAREGLIDILCPYRWGWAAGEADLEMDYFCEAVAGTPVLLLPFLNTWRDRDPVRVLEEALRLCRWPISGFSFWDFRVDPGFLMALRNLACEEQIRSALETLKAGPIHRRLTFLDGAKVDKYDFGWNL